MIAPNRCRRYDTAKVRQVKRNRLRRRVPRRHSGGTWMCPGLPGFQRKPVMYFLAMPAFRASSSVSAMSA